VIKQKVLVFLFVLYLLAGAIPLTSSAQASDSFVVDGITYCVLEDGLAAVGDGAFRNCHQLRRVTLGENVRRIGAGAFENCTRLYDAQLLKEEYVLAGSVFKNCISLREINLGRVRPGDNFEGSGLLLLHTKMRRDAWVRAEKHYPVWSQLPWHTMVVFESNGPVISLNTVLLAARILLAALVVIAGIWIIRKRKKWWKEFES